MLNVLNVLKKIEKQESLVYSMDSGISLGLKDVPKLEGSSPFFGTSTSKSFIFK